jgi:hypothetical protein
MAMKFKINKAAYDKLSDEFKGEYIAGDKDGEYVLDVSDLPQGEDVEPVKRALASEREKNKSLTTKVRELQTTIDSAPDVAALTAEHEKTTGKLKTFAEKTLVDNAALALATKISTSPSLLLPHIRSRLVADMSGDEPVTKVLGADGKPGDLTIEKLGEEFVANKDFAAIIKASNGSGGGTPPKPTIKPLGSGMQPNGGEQADANVDLSKLPAKDMAARIAERKAAAAAAAQQ